MTVLTHVCFSDLHCGAPNSLLTPRPRSGLHNGSATSTDPAELTSGRFAKALMATISELKPAAPPDIILLGDVYDLSFGTPATAAAAFTTLLKNLREHDAATRLGRFLIVPGNHDHSLWTAQHHQRSGQARAVGGSSGAEVYTTLAFADPDQLDGSWLIENTLREAGFSNLTATYYPNLGLRSADGTRAVVLHHGHFVEPLYTLISSLISGLTGGSGLNSSVEEIESLNGPWIDFFWSTIGEAGKASKDAFLIYDYLLTGSESTKFQHRLVEMLAEWPGQALPFWRTKPMQEALHLVASGLVDAAVGSFGQMQRFDYTKVLGDDGIAGLRAYLDGPTWRQMLSEMDGQPMPAHMSFVFGHTHKPFEDRLPSARFVAPPAVYNTGGWVLDTPSCGTREGASVLFIDDALNLASLRLFGPPAEDGPDPKGSEPVPVRVMTADGQNPAGNPMAVALQQAVEAHRALWMDFSKSVDATYRDKQAYIIDVLRRRDQRTDGKGRVI